MKDPGKQSSIDLVSIKKFKNIYDNQCAIHYVMGGDLYKNCVDKGIPGELVKTFMNNDSSLENLIKELQKKQT